MIAEVDCALDRASIKEHLEHDLDLSLKHHTWYKLKGLPTARTSMNNSNPSSSTLPPLMPSPSLPAKREAAVSCQPTLPDEPPAPKSSLFSYADPVTPQTVHRQPVYIKYSGVNRRGTMHLITTQDYLNTFYARFFDIPPSISPSYETTQDAHVLIHSVQGLTWVGDEVFATLKPILSASTLGPDGKSTEPAAVGFIALTDSPTVTNNQPYLGECDKYGNFTPSKPTEFENIILAWPINHEIGAVDFPTQTTQTRKGPVYPPRPAGPEFFTELGKVQHSLTQPNALTKTRGFRKQYLKDHHRDLLDMTQKTLRPDHVFWPSRNNNALLDTAVWKTICLPTQVFDYKDEMKTPEPYWQHVFVDKRERERWFPGSDLLVEGVYEFPEDEVEEAKKFLEVELGSLD